MLSKNIICEPRNGVKRIGWIKTSGVAIFLVQWIGLIIFFRETKSFEISQAQLKKEAFDPDVQRAATRNGTPRPVERRDISFTHIPKVAGTSFNKEVQPHLAQQDCYDAMRRPDMMNVVFFRDPRNHVQSQFLYCKHNRDWARFATNGTDFPRTDDDDADFRVWLRHFVAFLEPGNRQFGPKHDYNCIDPRDVQTRHMSCHSEPNPRANHALAVDPNITHAIDNMHDATMIGLSNYYHESICLLRLHQNGILPDDCHCNATEAKTTEHVALSHGVPKHSANDLSPDVIAMIDSLTKLDRMLFVGALQRFLHDIETAEKANNRQFMCDPRRSEAQQLLKNYMRSPTHESGGGIPGAQRAATRNGTPRPVERRDISFTHIPKVAGTSFNKEVQPHLAQQDCYDAMRRPDMMNVVFFRDPRNHVQSQFLYCKHNRDWARFATNGTDFPRTDDDDADFRVWLRHFVAFLEPGNRQFGPKHDYNCIDPRDVQTRHMSCHSEPNPRANHALAVDPNITHAIDNMHDATMIGLSNYYHESICLLRLHQNGILPDDCHCNATEAKTTEHVALSHGVPKHSANDLSPDVIAMIDSLTKLDRMLFVGALQRFLHDIETAEKANNRQFMCDPRRSEAQQLLKNYMRSPTHESGGGIPGAQRAATRNGTPRPVERRDISFTHIPKVAGTSFNKEVQPHLAQQDCYDAMRRPDMMNVVFFRDPRNHVQSQFLYCKHNRDWARFATNGTDFPRTDDDDADFRVWLRHFVAFLEPGNRQFGPKHDYNCIDPRDVQTRHMSCHSEPNPRANHALAVDPNITHAIDNMHDATMIGLSNYYHESICLLRLHQNGILPDDCHCNATEAKTTEHVALSHGVPKHSANDLSPDVIAMIDSLTKLDRMLFVGALQRFLHDIETAEKANNRQFMCDPRRSEAQQLLKNYMRSPTHESGGGIPGAQRAATRNGTPRPVERRDISFTHIPKVAGTSFNKEVQPHLAQQDCYDAMRRPDMMNVVFFRDPRNHVQSQFLYCKHNRDWARFATNGTDFPRTDDDDADFRVWLRHFVAFLEPGNRQFGPKHDYNCIDPRDVQTRHMSCHSEPNPRANHALAVDPNITHAIDNMHDATMIGLSNYYHESICLLRLHQNGILPDDCHCNATEAKTTEHVALSHGVPKHSANDLSPDVIAMIDSLTKLDRMLFVGALQRFLHDIETAEKANNRQFMCDPRRSEAQQLLKNYMRSPTHESGGGIPGAQRAATRNGTPRPVERRDISFTHIPKVAGTSFNKEVQPHLAQQDCYDAMRRPDMMNVVFFRDPRNHVQSQFLYCKHNRDWARFATNGTDFPRTDDDDADFRVWLRHFVAFLEPGNRQFGPKHDYNCIDPRDVQTRHMSCHSEPNPRANHALAVDPNITHAIDNMHDATMIGLSNYYHESICLLRLHQNGILPDDCHCNATEAKTTEHVALSHGVPKHSANDLSPDVIAMIDSLTKLDRMLFVGALQRFLHDIETAEKANNRQFMCDPRRSESQQLLKNYMRSPTH